MPFRQVKDLCIISQKQLEYDLTLKIQNGGMKNEKEKLPEAKCSIYPD